MSMFSIVLLTIKLFFPPVPCCVCSSLFKFHWQRYSKPKVWLWRQSSNRFIGCL